jgi:hypothetical protein
MAKEPASAAPTASATGFATLFLIIFSSPAFMVFVRAPLQPAPVTEKGMAHEFLHTFFQ